MNMTPQTHDPSILYGKDVDDAAVVAYAAAVDPDISTEDDDGDVVWWSEQAGLELDVDEATRRIRTIHIFGGRGDGGRYPYLLPKQLDFDMTREQVRNAMGAPDAFGPNYDTWETGPFKLTVQYVETGLIKKVGIWG
jgi:hypothetical protein